MNKIKYDPLSWFLSREEIDCIPILITHIIGMLCPLMINGQKFLKGKCGLINHR